MDTPPVSILFALSDTGSGHRSAAIAISAALDQVTPERIISHQVDMLRLTGIPAPQLYSQLSTRWLRFYNLSFHLTNNIRSVDMLSRLIWLHARHTIGRMLLDMQPDMVVVTHPLIHRLIGAARRTYNLPCKIITVVTDLVTLHAAWTYAGADLCLVPTDEAYRAMRRAHTPPPRMIYTGFPVHPKFVHYQRTQAEARHELALPPTGHYALITNGGVGSGRLRMLIPELERACPDTHFLVVTGTNQQLHHELETTPRSPTTKIYGFVHNMEVLMAASDVVITKAGPGTIMEAMAIGRPLVVTEAVGMQESGNIDFVLNHRLGYFCPTTDHVVQVLHDLRRNPHSLRSNQQWCRLSCNGATRIAHLLLERYVPHYPRTHHADAQISLLPH